MPAELTIRPFTPADQTAAEAVVNAGLAERWGTLDRSRNPDLRDIAAAYPARGHAFYVGTVDGIIVATGALTVAGAVGRIERMSVAAAWRGHGFGRAMTEHLIAAARRRGLTTLLVETNHDWHSAVRLYRACGFTPVDRDDESVHMRLILPPDGAPDEN